jgi:hypothetical protein
VDLQPIIWDRGFPLVCDIDHIVEFPFQDPAKLKVKLQIYTLFA